MLTTILIAAALQTASPWHVLDESSQIDGKRSYTAGVMSTNSVPNILGRPSNAMLALSCEDGTRRVILKWSRPIGHGETRITYRFDGGEAAERRVDIVTHGTTMILQGRDGERFMDEMSAAGRVVVRVAGVSNEAVFEVPDAADYVDIARAACPRT
jgi:hypothetical protein